MERLSGGQRAASASSAIAWGNGERSEGDGSSSIDQTKNRSLRSGAIAMLFLLSAVLVVVPHASAQTSSYVIHDLGVLPGFTNSEATAINEAGQIVGTSYTIGGTGRAFLWQNGAMTDLGTLGGPLSKASAINDRGQVVGTSQNSTGSYHGFLWQDGVMTDLGTLGGDTTFANDINDAGKVVGWSLTTSRLHAFLWDNGVMTDLGAVDGHAEDISEAAGINAAGEVVGWISEHNATRWQGGAVADLGNLGGVGDSRARAINEAGMIVGQSPIPGGTYHAFRWESGTMTDLGAFGPESEARGINAGGSVVGWSLAPSGGLVYRAILWEAGVMTDLGTLGGNESMAFGINDAADVVGWTYTTSGDSHATLWTSSPANGQGGLVDLGTLAGDDTSIAYAINNEGQVVGVSGTCSDYRQHAFLWKDGVMTALGALPGDDHSVASDINNAGQVVGWSYNGSGYPRAVLWDHGTITSLGNVSGANGINDRGQVVGWFQTASGYFHAFLWQNGAMTDLGTPEPTRVQSGASAINNAGQIAMTASNDDGDPRAFLWENGTWTDVGNLTTGAAVWANGINDIGQIIGISGSTHGSAGGAFLWQNAVITDLGNLGGRSGFDAGAYGINDAGQVVGSSELEISGPPYTTVHAFQWEGGAMTDLGDLGYGFSRAYGINDGGHAVGYSRASVDGCQFHAVLWMGAPAFHDVAVSSASTHPRYAVVGTDVSVDATIQNLGTQTESFDVRMYVDYSVVATQSVTGLAAGASLNVTLTWGTAVATPGTYAISIEAVALPSDANKSNNQVAAGTVSLYPPATAGASTTPSSTDVGLAVSFTCTASGGVPPLAVHWDFGDGTSDSRPTTSHAYAYSGMKTATCTVTDNAGNTVSDQTVVEVFPAPAVTASVDQPNHRPGETVNFTAAATGGSGGLTFNWGFGDGLSGEGATVSHAYTSPGSYTAIVTVHDSVGGSASNTVTVTVSAPPPALRATASVLPAATDVGLTVTFLCAAADGMSPYEFAWDFGDGTTGQGATVSHVYDSAGAKTATCTVTDAAGGSKSSSTTVQVYLVPAVTATVDRPSASPGTDLNFTASATGGSGVFTFSWGFGDGSSANGPIITHAYEKPGQYTVVVTVQDSVGGSAPNTVAITVTVSFLTTTAIQSTTESVAGEAVAFSAVASGGSGGPYVFTWDFGDGESRTGPTATHVYVDPGSYTPKITVTDAKGASQTRILETITVRGSSPAPSVSGSWPGYMNVAIGTIVVTAVVAVVAMFLLRRRPPKP